MIIRNRHSQGALIDYTIGYSFQKAEFKTVTKEIVQKILEARLEDVGEEADGRRVRMASIEEEAKESLNHRDVFREKRGSGRM